MDKKINMICSWILFGVIILELIFGAWFIYSIANEGFWYHYWRQLLIGIILIMVLGVLIVAINNTIKYFKK